MNTYKGIAGYEWRSVEDYNAWMQDYMCYGKAYGLQDPNTGVIRHIPWDHILKVEDDAIDFIDEDGKVIEARPPNNAAPK